MCVCVCVPRARCPLATRAHHHTCTHHTQPTTNSSYKALASYAKDDARAAFLRILRTLPYGNAAFFAVRRIDDPIGLLPARLILGINKRGVHFFRPVPKEYLHSAELRDIMQFGSSSQVCFWGGGCWWCVGAVCGGGGVGVLRGGGAAVCVITKHPPPNALDPDNAPPPCAP